MNNKSNKIFLFNSGVSESWKPYAISLPKRVDFLLQIKGHSRNWLADEIQINKGTLSKILNGHWIPTAKIKLKMAEALGVDSLVLFGDSQYFEDYKKTIQAVRKDD